MPFRFGMPERRMRGVCHFFTELVAMATSLEISEKEFQIDHLHPKRFHLMKRLRTSVQQIPEIIVLRAIVYRREAGTHQPRRHRPPTGPHAIPSKSQLLLRTVECCRDGVRPLAVFRRAFSLPLVLRPMRPRLVVKPILCLAECAFPF